LFSSFLRWQLASESILPGSLFASSPGSSGAHPFTRGFERFCSAPVKRLFTAVSGSSTSRPLRKDAFSHTGFGKRGFSLVSVGDTSSCVLLRLLDQYTLAVSLPSPILGFVGAPLPLISFQFETLAVRRSPCADLKLSPNLFLRHRARETALFRISLCTLSPPSFLPLSPLRNRCLDLFLRIAVSAHLPCYKTCLAFHFFGRAPP